MKKLVLALLTMLFIACSREAKVTMDPYKDAKTYCKFLEADDAEGAEAYLTVVVFQYRQAGKMDDLNKMTDIVGDYLVKGNLMKGK